LSSRATVAEQRVQQFPQANLGEAESKALAVPSEQPVRRQNICDLERTDVLKHRRAATGYPLAFLAAPLRPIFRIGSIKTRLLRAWQTPIAILFRKIINTFRPTARFLGWLQGGRAVFERDVIIWRHEGVNSTRYFSRLDADALALLDQATLHALHEDRILDICCNQGRLLLELKRRSYRHVYGFDIMTAAIDALKANPHYDPAVVHVEQCLAQDYFSDKADSAFDWAIAYSAVIELIHPSFDIFKELSRTVRKGMFLVINESGHTYPRFYRLLHRLNGFQIVSVRRLSGDVVLIHSIKRPRSE
jgi:SAM-dependent methyltransferase